MFDPAGAEAREVLELFWLLLAGAAIIWVLVVGGTWYAVRWRPRQHTVRTGQRLILYGGVVVPTALLAALAVIGLLLMTELRSAPAERVIRVVGEQFWWRVQYLDGEGSVLLETANHIVLPKDQVTELRLVTADVIHSFWVPALAGKMDMIPGRTNRLVLEPERTGTFRGQCAEFCGESHALMALRVRVTGLPEYQDWLRGQREPAREPRDPAARRGRATFLAYGCGACHRVRGTPADGRIGPDLTHLAGRARLAAETLPNDSQALLAWLRHPDSVKPGSRMPAFHMLERRELADLVSYLRSLR